MIFKIKAWCEGIIVAIIISIIVEMLIPEGNNKKYVKVVIGIYIMFVVINPILELLNYNFNFENILKTDTEETFVVAENDTRDVYIIGIQEMIKSDLSELGYDVENVNVIVDTNYENIEKIEIDVEQKSKDIIIKPIVIGQKDDTDDFDHSEILAYFKEKFFLDEDKIFFN